ncbi:response regulator [Rhizobacter sp. LjRoot28]|uniref:hybrid sensor histidine kinase/response regulator n=1 Tax=Rhizobacter sp. LjRoot28 TaxID=3342309 RepID=UPI003ECC968E
MMLVTESQVIQEVLVVDDNPATRYATSRVLRAAGFGVLEAGTGTEALTLADSHLAGVILDVHLPDINGFEVCLKLRERPATARVPVIHLSAAYIEDSDKVRGLHAGADAYITHPADPALLVATLQALIRARTAEDGRRRSEARFRAIYDNARSGLVLFDATGRIAEANPAFQALLRRSTDELVGRPLADFVPAEWHARLESLVATAHVSGWRGEFPLLTPSGDTVPVEWNLSSLVEPGLLLGVATDLSERMALSRQREALLEREQAARAAAERLNRVKDEFIAVLSHELRTPLNAIVSWVHVLKRAEAAPVLARGLESIERNALLQSRLVADILDVSRMNLGKVGLDLEPVDVKVLVETAVAALEPSWRERQLQIEMGFTGLTDPVVVDPARVQQIIWNLLTNATKFSTPGGVVRILCDVDGDGLTLTVADAGQGIAPDFLPHLFDRFTQAQGGANRGHGGLGLGLSIVRHLAELHGGQVEAFSEGLGKGATFVVRLPSQAPAGAVASGDAAPDPELDGNASHQRLAGMTVLVVDDDTEAREMLDLLLSDRGARVVTAASSAEGLARLSQEPGIDVLVSDIGMPGEDGYAFIDAVRRREGRGRRLPAVALTAFARPQDREVALAAGFDAHCGKPLRPNALVAAIREVASRTSASSAPGASADPA